MSDGLSSKEHPTQPRPLLGPPLRYFQVKTPSPLWRMWWRKKRLKRNEWRIRNILRGNTIFLLTWYIRCFPSAQPRECRPLKHWLTHSSLRNNDSPILYVGAYIVCCVNVAIFRVRAMCVIYFLTRKWVSFKSLALAFDSQIILDVVYV